MFDKKKLELRIEKLESTAIECDQAITRCIGLALQMLEKSEVTDDTLGAFLSAFQALEDVRRSNDSMITAKLELLEQVIRENKLDKAGVLDVVLN